MAWTALSADAIFSLENDSDWTALNSDAVFSLENDSDWTALNSDAVFRVIPYSAPNPDYDLTAFVTSIQFSYGMNNPFLDFAPPARAYVSLSNYNGDFNPDNASATFYDRLRRGQIVRIYINYNGQEKLLFSGKIVNRDYGVEDFLTLTIEDQMLRLLNTNITPPLLPNARIDEAIKSVFTKKAALWPYDFRYFTIGTSKLGFTDDVVPTDQNNVLLGDGELGKLGYLANLELDEAKTTLTYAGDVTLTETSAQTYLRELMPAEGGGRFFWDAPYECFRFQNRWTDSVNLNMVAELDGSEIESALFSMDDDLINDVTINYRPRSVSNSVTVLYEAPNTTTLKTSETLDLTVTFKDPANPGSTCGGLDTVCILGTDLIINTQQDGSGTNVTQQQSITVEFNATSATFNITNTTSNDLYITKLQVRGKPISLLNVETVEYTDLESIRDYDIYPADFNLPAVDNKDLAETIGRILVRTRKVPKRRFRRVTFVANMNPKLMGYAKDLSIGDGINLQYDSHNMDYVIVGFEHSISPGGSNAHRVSMWVRSVDTTNRLFVIGTSEIGGTDVIVF